MNAQDAPARTPSPPLQAAFQSVGQPVSTFRPYRLRLAVGMSAAILWLQLNAWIFINGWSWTPWMSQGIGLPITLVSAAIALWAWLRQLRPLLGPCSQRLSVCPGGLVRQRWGRVETFRWDEMESITPIKDHTVVSLWRPDGTRWRVTDLDTPRIVEFCQAIYDSSEPYDVRWTIVESTK
jgi:hypothetical protein